MSSEWVVQKLSSLGTFDRGKSKHRPRDAAHLYGGPYPFVQTGDVTSSGGRITTYRQTYSEAGLAQSKLWPENTLCITIAANIAETGLLTFPACFPDSVVGFTANPDKADVRYIEFIFRAYREAVKRRAYGSVQENINLEVLRDLEFPIPGLKTQRKIADFLSVLDDRIALLRETNATLEAMAQALFKSWFVDFDPVHANAGNRATTLPAELQALFPSTFTDTPQGPVPMGWRLDSLASLMDIAGGTQPPASEFLDEPQEGYIRLIQIRDYETDAHLTFVPKTGKLRTTSAEDIMIARYGASVGRICWGLDGAYNVALVRVVCNSNNREFLRTYLQSNVFQAGLAAVSGRSAQAGFNKGDIASFKLVIPPDEMLALYQNTIWPMRTKILHNRKQAHTLATLRDTLLPRLISGQLRLPGAEAALAEAGA